MIWDAIVTWPTIIAWCAAGFSWGIVGFGIFQHRRYARQYHARWDRMFADLNKDTEHYFTMLQQTMEAKRELDEQAWRVMQLRLYLLAQMDKRGIPYPDDIPEVTTKH